MKNLCLLLTLAVFSLNVAAQKDATLKKKDRKRDVLLVTDYGEITIRLSDATPLHRDNFLKLVKVGFYDGVLFHRVMRNFMIQTGDPDSKNAAPGKPLGMGSPGYTILSEFVPSLFHKKGAVAAARMPDNMNPEKASNGSQFYIVQGNIFNKGGIDSMELYRLNGKKILPEFKEVYTTIGGAPHLDGSYTVFGEVIKGIEIVDKIAVVKTSVGQDKDRPLEDIKIIKAVLIKRKKNKR